MTNPIINIQGVDLYQINHQVFKNITLKINKGDFLYLIGDTGSGKSSLLKALYAELKVHVGNISVVETNLINIGHNEIPILRRKIGIVFQDFQLLKDRNVFANLDFVLEATGWKDKNKRKKRIREVLDSVHLSGIDDKMIFELSGGEQQRATIARALLNHPQIILADEPTGNLDPKKSEKIIELLKDINSNGTTIIIATHDYTLIKKHQARILKCGDKKITEIEADTL